MQLTLLSIRRLPKSKTTFSVLLSADEQPHRDIATIKPRLGHAVAFDNPNTAGILIRSGPQARLLADAILAYARGQKLQLPLRFPATPASPPASPLTIKPSREPRPFIGVG
ncbi:MAG TPA: hypothetical protein VH253_10745 [Phycisphaerae bacterium]|nr:hypothetical protein [Phycisphaerae bacterium]